MPEVPFNKARNNAARKEHADGEADKAESLPVRLRESETELKSLARHDRGINSADIGITRPLQRNPATIESAMTRRKAIANGRFCLVSIRP